MKSYTDITYRYLKVQKKRTILTILGIILSVALITAIGTMVISVRDRMIREAIRDHGDYHIEFTAVPGDKVERIKDHLGVKKTSLTGSTEFAVVAPISEEERKTGGSSSTPPYRYLTINAYNNSSFDLFPIQLKEGRLPEKSNEIIIDYWMLKHFPGQPQIGDRIKVDIGWRTDPESGRKFGTNEWSEAEVFQKTDQREYTIVGLINPKTVWMGAYTAKGISMLDEKIVSEKSYNVFVKMDSPKGVHTKALEIAKTVGLPKVDRYGDSNRDYDIRYNESLLRLSAQSIDKQLNTTLFLMLAFIIFLVMVSTSAIIYNAFNISVLERISQFGILRCTGASPAQIKRMVFKEAWIVSAIGIPIGLVCGLFAMEVVLYIISQFSYSFSLFDDLKLTLSPAVLGLSTILGIITVFVSVYGPARQASKISALEAVRNTGAFKKENFKKVKKAVLSRMFFGFEGQLAFKNLRRNRKRFHITVFSMVISIVLFIVFGSFVGYIFKMNVVNNNRAADFSIYASGMNGGKIDPSLYHALKAFPQVDGIYKDMNRYAEVLAPESKINPRFAEMRQGMLGEKKDDRILLYNSSLTSYGDDALSELKKNLRDGSIDAETINKENGVIIMQTGMLYSERSSKGAIMDVTTYKVGDTIEFQTDASEPDQENAPRHTLKVVAVLNKGILYNEYNQNGGINMITTEAVYKKITGIDEYNQMYIQLKPGADKEPVSKYLKENQDKNGGYQFIDSAERAKENRTDTIIMSIFLYGFVAVITLIGCLNIINTISTNLLLRTREISMLKAVGTTKGGIRKMVCMEGILYGCYAAFYGGIIGSLLSYVLFHIMIGIRDFEWSIPWSQIIVAITGAILVALLSSYLPLRKINQNNIIDGIRMEE